MALGARNLISTPSQTNVPDASSAKTDRLDDDVAFFFRVSEQRLGLVLRLRRADRVGRHGEAPGHSVTIVFISRPVYLNLRSFIFLYRELVGRTRALVERTCEGRFDSPSAPTAIVC